MKNNLDLLNWICEQYSEKEVFQAMIDYNFNDIIMQHKWDSEFEKITYKHLPSKPLPVYPQWEIDFIKNNIK